MGRRRGSGATDAREPHEPGHSRTHLSVNEVGRLGIGVRGAIQPLVRSSQVLLAKRAIYVLFKRVCSLGASSDRR